MWVCPEFLASSGNSMHLLHNISLTKYWSYDFNLTSREMKKRIILVCSGRGNIIAEHLVSLFHRLPSGHQILSSLFLLLAKHTHPLTNEDNPKSHAIVTSSSEFRMSR